MNLLQESTMYVMLRRIGNEKSSKLHLLLESLTSFDGVVDSCCKQDYHARALSGVHLRLHPAVWVRVIDSTVLPSSVGFGIRVLLKTLNKTLAKEVQ